jgi:hypothetical protein
VKLSDLTLVYTYEGSVSHLLEPSESPQPPGGDVFCRIQPYSITRTGWHGTGSQEEYVKAALLPICRRCAHLFKERQ